MLSARAWCNTTWINAWAAASAISYARTRAAAPLSGRRKRRPRLDENKCLSCMLCSFVCPVEGLISYKEMPQGWQRDETPVMEPGLEKELKLQPFVMKEDAEGCKL
jgi:formate hydrogenlyase subunit 6/NADH:ubiquinone oxidoreductase subunit I